MCSTFVTLDLGAGAKASSGAGSAGSAVATPRGSWMVKVDPTPTRDSTVIV